MGLRNFTPDSGEIRSRAFPGELAQLVGCPIGARQQCAGLRIVEDLLVGNIPLQLAANHHGDKAEVAWNCGVMRRLNRGDGGFTGFYGVQEVTAVFC